MSRPIAATKRKKPLSVKAPEWKLELCQLGGFRPLMVDKKGRYDPRNCNQPAVVIVAGVQICRRCSGILASIVEVAKSQEGHRTPVIEHTELLRGIR